MNNEEFSMKLNEIKERVLSSSTPEDESKYTESLFESIKHIDKQENEFWYARELQAALEQAGFQHVQTHSNKMGWLCVTARK